MRNHPSQRLMIKCLTIIKLELLVFEERPLGARKRTTNKFNPHMTPGLGIDPGSHWWEASVFTTAPSLLPQMNRETSRSNEENHQQIQPTYDAGSGNRSRSHWWEASALTTAQSLLPQMNTYSFGAGNLK